MLLMYAIALIFVIWAFVNYKKCILFWCVFSIVLNLSFCLKYSPPAITVTLFINVILTLLYFFKNHKCKDKIPILGSIVLVVLSYIITFLFADLKSNTNILLSLIINEFVILYIFYSYIETKEDIRYIFKIGFWIIIISILYAIITLLLQDNPIIRWESGLSGEIAKVVVADQTDRGMKLQSFFSSATDFNIYLCIFFIFLLFNADSVPKKYQVLLICSIIILTLMSKNRAGMMALGILLLIMSKDMKQIRIFLLFGCFIFFFLYFFNIHFVYLESFFSDEAQDQVGGSSLDMRKGQLDVVLLWLQKSPIWGLGLDAVSYIREFDYSIYGAESIWFRLLLERGLLGLIAYILVIVSCYNSVTNRYIKKYLLYLIIYWISINSFTLSSTGLFYPFLLAYIILIKCQKILLTR